MFGLLAITLVVVVVIVAMARRGKRPLLFTAAQGAPVVPDVLDTAVAQGVISADQAARIRSLATGAAPETPAARAWLVELFGYLGSALVLTGVVLLVAQFWTDIGVGGRLGLVGATAALLTLAGLVVPEERGDLYWRLRSIVLLLGSGAVAFFGGLIAFDALKLAGETGAMMVGAMVVVHGGLLWFGRDRPAQQLATLGGAITVVAGLGMWVAGPGVVGWALVTLGLAWLLAGRLGRFEPGLVAVILGAALSLVGAGVTAGDWPALAPLAGLALAIAFVVAGSVLDDFRIGGPGVAGIMVYLPWATVRFFGDALGAPVALLLAGSALLIAMYVTLKRHRPPSTSGRGHNSAGLVH